MPINHKLSKKDGRNSIKDSSKLLAEFFNGVIIDLEEEYRHEA